MQLLLALVKGVVAILSACLPSLAHDRPMFAGRPLRAICAAMILPIMAGASDSGAYSATSEIPLSIDIITELNFSRTAITGNGQGAINLDPSGTRRAEGGAVALGGYAFAGSVIIHGSPGRGVRVDLPITIRMSSASGGLAEITNIRSTLGPAPRLDMAGELRFSFGGTLIMHGNVNGTLRGRIPISAEYE